MDDRCIETDSKDFLTILKSKIDLSYSLLDVGSGVCILLDQYKCNIILALEIHRPYLVHRKNQLPHILPINADAKDLNQLFLPKTFSTVLFSDSIEHFSKKDSLHLLKVAEEIAIERIVVFTPRGFFPQKGHDYFQMKGETYQEHRSGWEVEEFLELDYHVIVLKNFHDSMNPSFVKAFGKDHPPVDAIIAWKELKNKHVNNDMDIEVETNNELVSEEGVGSENSPDSNKTNGFIDEIRTKFIQLTRLIKNFNFKSFRW